MEISKILKDLRKKHGLTQQEVADRVGIDRTAYSVYERGARIPKLSTLGSILYAIDPTMQSVPIWQIMSDYFDIPLDDSIRNSLYVQLDKEADTLVQFFSLLNEEGRSLVMLYISSLFFSRRYNRRSPPVDPSIIPNSLLVVCNSVKRNNDFMANNTDISETE